MGLFKKSGPDNPIAIAQDALAEERFALGNGLIDSIDRIVTQTLWQKDTPFSLFNDFAVAPTSKGGLGVRSITPAKLLRFALMHRGHLLEWTEVLLAIMREPGRPKTRDNEESFHRFYKVGTSTNCQDRVLVTLHRDHPAVFDEVCRRECTIAGGAIKAGLRASFSHRWQLDLQAILRLDVHEQVVRLCDLFFALDLKTQAAFVGQVFEGALGAGMAEQWCELHRSKTPRRDRVN